MSGTPVHANLISFQGFKEQDKLIRLGRSFTFRYNIGGGIINLDANDEQISRIIESDDSNSKYLEDLENATVHYFNHRPTECIKVLFKAIENNKTIENYHKYESLRHLFTHEPPYRKSTIKLFTQEFDEHCFDYEKYDPENGLIVIDMMSNKNIRILNKLASQLIVSVKKSLGLV
jgi:hypothetical protein